MRNRKGTDKILAVYWFAILFIVAAGIIYMTLLVYGKPFDVREMEASLLADKVADCVAYGGILDESFLTNENSKENLFVVCGINSEVEDTYGWREQEQYYLEVTISDFKAGPGSIYFSGRDGNLNLKDDCTIKGEGLPVCVNRQFYTYGEKGGSSLVKILSIVKKTDKNVR